MKLLKPNWVHHDGQDVFSIDVHPDGSRFATGGQGKDSGKIVIWNMGPVVDKEKENDENSPRILCQMEHHIACVNIVRWSNKGMFLASGSDDKLIMIWQYAHGNNFGNIENWKCGFTLRGHNGDVLDLAWSNNDELLATCSIDNTIIVWNAHKFPEIIQRVNAHAGLVKGVTWDPVGSFLASQSDDKTLKIWRTSDWGLEKTIEEPFKQSAGTTHVLRLNWSPDGQLLISAHAVNNGVPTAQVINRANNWNHKIDFVGHQKAVTVVRFFPQILKLSNSDTSEDSKNKVYCLCGLGSRDRSISIWQTNYSRPLCVIQDLFDNPVMDLAWSKQPTPGLLACSTDGTMAYLQFEYNEIGYPLSKAETDEFFMKKYNHDLKVVAAHKLAGSTAAENDEAVNKGKEKEQQVCFIENFDALIAQEQKEKQVSGAQQTPVVAPRNPFKSPILNENSSNSLLSNRINVLSENQKQIERRLADGRRRITPICVSKPGDYDAPRPFGSVPVFGKATFSSSIGFSNNSCGENSNFENYNNSQGSNILIEKRNERNEVVEISPAKCVVYTRPASQSSNENKPDLAEKATTVAAATAASVTSKNSFSQQTTTTMTTNNNNKLPRTNATSSSQLAPKSTDQAKPSGGGQAMPLNSAVAKPVVVKPAGTAVLAKQASITNTPSRIPEFSFNTEQVSKEVPVSAEDTPKKAAAIGQQQLRQLLPALKQTKNSFTKIIQNDGKEYTLEVHNSVSLLNSSVNNSALVSGNQNEDFNVCLVKLYVDKKYKWQVYVMSKVSEITCNKSFVSIVCEDSTMNLIKLQNGTQICSPIVLDSQAATLSSISNYVMCLSVYCNLYVWQYDSNSSFNESAKSSTQSENYFNLNTLINQLPCHFIFQHNENFLKAFLTENGIPIVIMSQANVNRPYYYSMETKCWHLIPIGDNSTQMLINSSSVFNSISFKRSLESMNKCGPLELVQSRFKSTKLLKTIETLNKVDSTKNTLFNKQDFTLVHLEAQMNASIGLNSPKEYKFWLLTYARYLVENDYEDKLTELCNHLLGPLYSINWNQNIMIFKKRELLKEILPLLATNLKFQRMHSLFKQQLNLISSFSQKSSVLDRLVMSSSNTLPNRQENLAKSCAPAAVKNLHLVKESQVTFSIDAEQQIEVSTAASSTVDVRSEKNSVENETATQSPIEVKQNLNSEKNPDNLEVNKIKVVSIDSQSNSRKPEEEIDEIIKVKEKNFVSMIDE